MGLLITAVAAGLGGAFTPCTLGVNLVMIHLLSGKPRAKRLLQWALFAVSRALLLTGVGLVIGLLGQVVTTFTWWFQMGMNVAIVVMGILFIAGRKRPVLGGLNLGGNPGAGKTASAAGLGMLFGMNVTACVAPLVLALLAGSVAAGDWLLGAVSLFVFGTMLSAPVLAAVFSDKAAAWVTVTSRKHRSVFYFAAGGILIVLGSAEILLSLLVIPG